MSTTLYNELKTGLCRLLNIADAPPADGTVPNGGDAFSLWIDEIPVLLCYFPAVDADRVSLICDYGDIPEDVELLVLRHAMEKNFLLHRGSSCTYARDPLRGTLVLLGELDLGSTTPESALEMVRDFATNAAAFSVHRFSDELRSDAQGASEDTANWQTLGGLA